jgi:hypothetical protein
MSKATHSIFKYFRVLFGAFCLISLLPPPGQSATLFQSGWERNPGKGCTAPRGVVDLHIVDRATADDSAGFDYDHSSDPCALVNGYPAMATVTSPVHRGNHSFRYHCPKDSSAVNGRGGVIPKTFSTTSPELYIRYYVRWDSNFRFVNYDYKSTFAMMTTGQHTYNSYYGDGGLTTGRLRFFWWGGTSIAPYSTNITLRRNTWHCMEWHLKYGAAGVGYAEAKVDGTLVQWTDGYGTKIGIESADSPYLGNFNGFRLDNTINGYYDGSFQNAVPADAFIYYDDVEINDGDGWIGCAVDPPRPPTGLRIVP